MAFLPIMRIGGVMAYLEAIPATKSPHRERDALPTSSTAEWLRHSPHQASFQVQSQMLCLLNYRRTQNLMALKARDITLKYLL